MADIKKFLDQDGVSTLWSRIAEELNKKAAASDVAINTADIATMKGQIKALEAGTYDDTEVRNLIKTNADAIDAIEADYLKAADKTELNSAIDLKANASDLTTLQDKVTTLIDSDADKSVRTIANEELAKQLIADGAQESLDTLAEIAAWIQHHPDDAAAMNEAITALQAKVNTGDKTVTAYVTEAIAALNIDDYAKADDLTALAGRVDTAEADISDLKAEDIALDARLDTLEGKVTDAKIAAWDAAEQNAKDYADSLAGNYDAFGAAAGALTSAKAYTDEAFAAVQALSAQDIDDAIAAATQA